MILAADWVVVSSLATAGGTLVLAIATFAAVRSANANARTSERALLAGMRPVLFPSRENDPVMYVTWVDARFHAVPGAQGVIDVTDEVIYFVANLRNAGAGIAVLHGWHVWTLVDVARPGPDPTVDDFRRQARDILIPPNGTGFFQGAIREVDDPDRAAVLTALEQGHRIGVDLLYGDLEGGQRTISRFSLRPKGENKWLVDVIRHWFIDNPDPR